MSYKSDALCKQTLLNLISFTTSPFWVIAPSSRHPVDAWYRRIIIHRFPVRFVAVMSWDQVRRRQVLLSFSLSSSPSHFRRVRCHAFLFQPKHEPGRFSYFSVRDVT